MRWFLGLLAVTCLVPSVRGDLFQYHVPGTNLVMTLQGRATVNPGRTVSFRHPKFKSIALRLEDVVGEIHRMPPVSSTGRRMLAKAKISKDPQRVLNAANWLLRHAELKSYYAAIDLVLELDPSNEEALRIKKLKEQMDQPVPEKPELEEKLRKEVRLKDFRIKRSKHFILFHDTPEKPAEGRRLNRADERLRLLETVYEVFLLKFHSQGVPLKIPEERLMVLLFSEHDAFLDYAENLSKSLILAAGFWSPSTNISVFYDNGTAKQFQVLDDLEKALRQEAKEARRIRGPGAADIIRRYQAISLLLKIAKESSDIEVVSHEATHQMAGNTGLFPRDVRIPRWVHEGLAAYFEAPNDATWAGLGAVNEQRLDWYRALAANDREHSSLDFIVGDRIFSQSGGIHSNILHAYGQAWALTHFLVERHFDKLMQYYQRLGQLPPDTPIPSDVLNDLFEEVFGEDRDHLESEWRDYMRSLKTDLEVILDDDDR